VTTFGVLLCVLKGTDGTQGIISPHGSMVEIVHETSYYTLLAMCVQALPAVIALCMTDVHQISATGAHFTAGLNVTWLYSPGIMLDHSKSNTSCSFFGPY